LRAARRRRRTVLGGRALGGALLDELHPEVGEAEVQVGDEALQGRIGDLLRGLAQLLGDVEDFVEWIGHPCTSACTSALGIVAPRSAAEAVRRAAPCDRRDLPRGVSPRVRASAAVTARPRRSFVPRSCAVRAAALRAKWVEEGSMLLVPDCVRTRRRVAPPRAHASAQESVMRTLPLWIVALVAVPAAQETTRAPEAQFALAAGE